MNKRQDVQFRSIEEGLITLKHIPSTRECAELRRLRGALDDKRQAIHRLSVQQHVAGQGTRGAGSTNDRDRRDIRAQHLIPIARRARKMFRLEPSVLRALRLPHAHDTLEAHADAALAIAKALRPHAKFCHSEGFRPGFLAELKAAGAALRGRMTLTTSARRQSATVTRQLTQAIREARELASFVDVEVTRLAHTSAADARGWQASPANQTRAAELAQLARTWGSAYKLGKPLGRPKKRRGPGNVAFPFELVSLVRRARRSGTPPPPAP